MKVSFDREAFEQFVQWQGQDVQVWLKLTALIRETMRTPFQGLGKPEPLRQQLRGWWSRRITGEHRFVYRMTGTREDQTLEIVACRYHYDSR